MSNHIHYNVGDEITNQYPNLHDAAVEVCEYLSMLGLKSFNTSRCLNDNGEILTEFPFHILVIMHDFTALV